MMRAIVVVALALAVTPLLAAGEPAQGAAAAVALPAGCAPDRDLSGLLDALEEGAMRATTLPSCEDIISGGKESFPDGFAMCAAVRAIVVYRAGRQELCGEVDSLLEALAMSRIQRETWKSQYDIKAGEVEMLKIQWQQALKSVNPARPPWLACGAGPAAALGEDGVLEARAVLACIVPFFRIGK